MGEFYSELNQSLQQFISSQKIFFVATAPRKGRINLSPKGMDTFVCINNKKTAYLDLTGSSNETAAHITENERLTIMFCSFSEKPLILRLYGRGRVIRRRDPEWEDMYPLFPPLPGGRQIVVLHIDSLQTSCGYGVSIFDFKEERGTLRHWADKKGEQGIMAYQRKHNRTSIDGLPTKLNED